MEMKTKIVYRTHSLRLSQAMTLNGRFEGFATVEHEGLVGYDRELEKIDQRRVKELIAEIKTKLKKHVAYLKRRKFQPLGQTFFSKHYDSKKGDEK